MLLDAGICVHTSSHCRVRVMCATHHNSTWSSPWCCGSLHLDRESLELPFLALHIQDSKPCLLWCRVRQISRKQNRHTMIITSINNFGLWVIETITYLVANNSTRFGRSKGQTWKCLILNVMGNERYTYVYREQGRSYHCLPSKTVPAA